MNCEQLHILTLRGTDVQGAVKRMCGDEQIYMTCLQQFLLDETMSQLTDAVRMGAWDDAFTAAHALKGLAGNMGFVPLMHATSQLVIVIRGGRTKEIGECLLKVNSHYRDITDAIQAVFQMNGEG